MPDLWLDVDSALSEVPINIMPLTDDTDFKTREESVVYNQAGLDLVWNFITTAGAFTQTAVTPTDTAGAYDWVNQGNGMYTIEIPATGGGTINNDTEGVGWFTGFATGILPWRGPTIGFRASGLNDALIDSAYSTTRGLAGTALPNAAADAAGGLPISDAGGLDIDTQLGKLVGTLATGTHNPQSGDAFARLGAPAGASVSADVAAVKVDTAATLLDTGTDGVVVAAASKTGYSLTATTGLGNQTADITGNLSGSVGSVTGAVGSVTGNVGGNVTGSVGSLATQAKADVNAEADTALSDFFTSAANLVDLIWDEVITGAFHNTNNSAAKFLREASEATGVTGTAQAGGATSITLAAGESATNDLYNFERVRIIEGTGAGQSRLITDYDGTTKVATVHRAWTTNPSTDSVYVISSADATVEAIGTNEVSATATVDFDDLAAILLDSDELQTDLTDGGRLDLLLDRLITELDTARAEPGQGAPAASAKIGAKIDYLYKSWRNKSTQTATDYKLYADDTTTVDQKRTVSDDGTTFTSEEVATGP
ncbi:MAG TPA: hypothetical protein VLA12_05270 [Planctomycetaceae bacterium]|nr:hypothetical protein [Planctomycetaceae bacterium]